MRMWATIGGEDEGNVRPGGGCRFKLSSLLSLSLSLLQVCKSVSVISDAKNEM